MMYFGFQMLCYLSFQYPFKRERGIKIFFIMSQFLKILDLIFNFITVFLSFTYGLTYDSVMEEMAPM